jgi:hypothetical protein
LAQLTGVTAMWLKGNRLTGSVPSLPFDRYTLACGLSDPGILHAPRGVLGPVPEVDVMAGPAINLVQVFRT